MADDVTLPAASGTFGAATDEIGGRHFQRIKVTFGADGVAGDVTAENPLPVSIVGGGSGLTNTELRASPVPMVLTAGAAAVGTVGITGLLPAFAATPTVSVAGTVTVAGAGNFAITAAALPLPAGAATAAGLTAINATLGAPYQAGGALPLPSGAATSAKQPAIGTSGTASPDVLTVQGIAGGVALPVAMTALPALPSGTNAIGSITNTAFGISGTLPGFAATPTFNLGTISTVATESTLSGLSGKMPATIGQKTMAASLAVTIASDQSTILMSGDTAAGATDAGNPVKIGGVASLGFPTAVAVGQRSNLWTGQSGQIVATLAPVAMAGADAVANTVNTFSDVQGNPVRLHVRPEGWNGATWDRLRVGPDFSLQTYVPDVVATGSITTQNLVPAGVATAGSAIELTLAGRGGVTIQVTGTYTGAISLQFTVDGTNWITVGGTTLLNVATGALAATIASATQGIFQTEASGAVKVRVTALAAVTGAAVVTIRATPSVPIVSLDNAVSIAAGQTVATVTTVGTITTGNIQPIAQTGFILASAASTNATVVKASAGQLLMITASNVTATAAFLKLYNKATAPTVGTDVPIITIPLAANSVVPTSFGISGQQFPLGIGLALTGLIANADTTAVAAGAVNIAATYR